MISNQQAVAPFQSASLYVGDLHNEVTEVFTYIFIFLNIGLIWSYWIYLEPFIRTL